MACSYLKSICVVSSELIFTLVPIPHPKPRPDLPPCPDDDEYAAKAEKCYCLAGRPREECWEDEGVVFFSLHLVVVVVVVIVRRGCGTARDCDCVLGSFTNTRKPLAMSLE